MQTESLQAVVQVVQVLEKLGAAYAIGGSFASSLYGRARSTMDADIIADLRPEHIDDFVAALSTSFYVDDEMIREAVDRRSSFNIIHAESFFKVDIFIPKAREFDRQQLARRVASPITPDAQTTAYVISPEDSVLAKLDWYRMGGELSDRQWRDILDVMKMQAGRLDLAYMRRLAESLKVLDLLERAMREATE